MLRKLIINLLIYLLISIFFYYCIRKQKLVETYTQIAKSLAVFLQAVRGCLLQITSGPPFQSTVCSQFLLKYVGVVCLPQYLLGPCLQQGHNPMCFIHIIRGLRQGQRRQQALPMWEFCPREILQELSAVLLFSHL